jgi:hypothetical protein
MRKTALIILCGMASIQVSMATLSVGNFPEPKNVNYVVNPYNNGNSVAQVKNMPLDAYIESIYSGYKVERHNLKNINISIKGHVPNNPVAILTYLSKAYGIAFSVDQKHHLVSVEKVDGKSKASNALAYKSLLDQNSSLSTENTKLNQQSESTNKSLKKIVSTLKEVNKTLKAKNAIK